MRRTGRRVRWPPRSGSPAAVSRIWRAFGLQPHRTETWKLSADPLFVDKVRDVVGLYLNPPERAVVLCVDEKSQIQALDRTQPILPMRPGLPERAPTTTSATAPEPVRRAGPRHRPGHRRAAHPPPRDRVQAVPQTLDRRSLPSSTSTWCSTTPPPTRPRDPALADRASPLLVALHSDQLVLAEPRRALVRRADHQEAQARRAPLRPRSSTPTSAPGSRPGTTNPKPYVWTKTADQILDSISRYCTGLPTHDTSGVCRDAPLNWALVANRAPRVPTLKSLMEASLITRTRTAADAGARSQVRRGAPCRRRRRPGSAKIGTRAGYLRHAEAAAARLAGATSRARASALPGGGRDLRVALKYALDSGDGELALSLSCSCGRWWAKSGRVAEGRSRGVRRCARGESAIGVASPSDERAGEPVGSHRRRGRPASPAISEVEPAALDRDGRRLRAVDRLDRV